MVHIEIDYGHPLESSIRQRLIAGDGRIVEQAEPGCFVFSCMMPRWTDGAEGASVRLSHGPVDGGNAAAGCMACGGKRVRHEYDILIVQKPANLRRILKNIFDIRLIMSKAELLFGGSRSSQMNQPGFDALSDQMILDFSESTLVFRMRHATDEAITVQQAIRMCYVSKIHLVAIIEDYRVRLSCESILRGLIDQSKIVHNRILLGYLENPVIPA